jgi:uncharacterized protein YuzE
MRYRAEAALVTVRDGSGIEPDVLIDIASDGTIVSVIPIRLNIDTCPVPMPD